MLEIRCFFNLFFFRGEIKGFEGIYFKGVVVVKGWFFKGIVCRERIINGEN